MPERLELARDAWMHENAGADFPPDEQLLAWHQARLNRVELVRIQAQVLDGLLEAEPKPVVLASMERNADGTVELIFRTPDRAPLLDPFVFVAATRYAIDRTLTSASEVVAGQVEAHAALIGRDMGAASAIEQEIADFQREVTDTLASGARLPAGQSALDLSDIAKRWQAAGEKLAEARNA